MSFELSASDRLLLEKHRLERLRSFFVTSLPFCFMQLDRRNALSIHCPQQWMVDQLLTEISRLRCYTWLVVGAESLTLCYGGKELYRTTTRSSVCSAQQA